MYISQITGYSNSYQTNRVKKSTFNKKNTSFKSYESVFRQATSPKLTDTLGVSKIYHSLIDAAKSEPGARFTNDFYKMPQLDNLSEYIYTIFGQAKNAIRSHGLKYGTPLINDAAGRPLLCVGEDDGLEFDLPVKGGFDYFNFSVDDENAVSVHYSNEYSDETFEFYPDRYIGTLRKHFRTSGTNMYNSVSKTTRYNKDGSERTVWGDLKKWWLG